MKKIFLTLLLLFNIAFAQTCHYFDRFIDGNYYDTYEICSDDIYIDLQDFSSHSDLFYISPVAGLNYQTGSQNIGNNQWKSFYKNVKVVPTSDIELNSFYFNTHDNWQSFGFTFALERTTMSCNDFYLDNNSWREYFSMDCQSALVAKTAEFKYVGQPAPFKGTLRSEHITITDGNNTSIAFDECCLLKADTLTLKQSAQNNVKIDGHLIVETLESEANLQLQYDDAVVTIGEMPSNIKIFGNENTTVNLCLNKTRGADKIGYFKGTIFYNTDAETGWTTSPSLEGDINYNDNSSDYWVWKNSNKEPEEIASYESYESCIAEYIDINLFIIEEEQKQEEKKEIKETKIIYNVIGQKLGTTASSVEGKNQALFLK